MTDKNKTFLSLGTYDGVHLGHRQIINSMLSEGHKRGFPCALAYFTVPPRFYFSGETENCLITLPEERREIMTALGIARITELPFNAALAAMTATEFFEKVILGTQNAAGLFVGADFAFGRDRSGDIEFLKAKCAEHNLFLKVFPFVHFEGLKISSSMVRAQLRDGEIFLADKCLGANYRVSGIVVRGAGLGRKLGFPTANISAHPAKILPVGVFAGKVRLDNACYSAVLNVGRRPTVSTLGGQLILEAHLLNFAGDLYGRTITAEFLTRLRSEKKFASKEELCRQISEDIKNAERFLSHQK